LRWLSIAPVILIAAPLLGQQPATSDSITVTATRVETRLADTPASVVVLDKAALAASPAPTIDDMLREVPGFTLFRRSGSRVANPTAQGVSLRGVGASGASRAIVLDDGIPLNDAFGGWIFWGRVARTSLDRIEVLRGGASDRYGSGAMGGVVQFLRRRDDGIVAEVSAGSESTRDASLFAAQGHGDWRASLAADLFNTGGYVLVEPGSRGPVDVNADSKHEALDAMLARGTTFLRASRYHEARHNGTPLQTNEATIRQLALGHDRGALSLRAYTTDNDYAQTFSAIAADRSSERLTVDQRVPSRSSGGSVQFAHVIASRNAVVAGGELRQVSGASNEDQFAVNGSVSHLRSEGRQRNGALFLEDVIDAAPRLSLTAGVRFDSWRNFDASRNTVALADRSDNAWSPRLSALFRATDRLALTASAYRAFRAPTLNELYRSFRVGNVLTNANESLGPETLNAFELGARFGTIRANAFVMNVDDTIANVTLSSTPSLITRQRRNLGSTQTRGLELESDWRVATNVRASAGYLFSDARVTAGSLDGLRLPQVPRHQATLQTTVTPPKTTIAAQLRWSSMQFDDDLNQLPLRSFIVADAFASYSVTSRISVTLSAENLLDRRIETGATPVITLGQPRAIRVGVRYGR
jgi:outer membrane receptor protein involved in Fe transport